MEAASSLGPLERSLGRNCHVSIAWVNCCCQQPLGVVLSSPEHLGVGHSGRGNCAWNTIPSLRFVLPGASPVVPATSAPGPHLISRLQGFVLRLLKPAARKSVFACLVTSGQAYPDTALGVGKASQASQASQAAPAKGLAGSMTNPRSHVQGLVWLRLQQLCQLRLDVPGKQ